MKIEAVFKPEGCKLLRIYADFSNPPNGPPLLTSIRIRGDFFFVPEESFEKIEHSLLGLSLDRLAERFDVLAAESGCMMAGINGSGIAETIRREIG